MALPIRPKFRFDAWLALAVAFLLLALGFAGRETDAFRRARSDLAAEKAQAAALAARLGRHERRAADAQRERARLLQEISALSAQVTRTSGAARPSANFAQKAAAASKAIQDPKYQAAMRRYFSDIHRNWYDAAFQPLHLSPAQVARYEDLYTSRFQPKVVATDEGDGHGSVNLSFNADVSDDDVRAALGDATEAALQKFNATMQLRFGIVDPLAGNLLYTDSPLAAPQAEQLLQVLAGVDAQHPSGQNGDPATVDWNRTLAQTRSFLSPTQQQALAQLSGQLSTEWDWGGNTFSLTRSAESTNTRDGP